MPTISVEGDTHGPVRCAEPAGSRSTVCVETDTASSAVYVTASVVVTLLSEMAVEPPCVVTPIIVIASLKM